MAHTVDAAGTKVAVEAVYLQPPPGERYVRSFVFSRRIDAPFARVHLLARDSLVLCLSSALLRTIDSAHPDLVSAALLWIFALLLFLGSGLNTRIARLYFLLTLPTLFSLFTTWFLFNPVPGHVILLQRPVYSGYVPLGLALWEVLWIVIVGGYFLWTRKVFRGIVIATLVTFVLTRLFALPEWIVTQVPFFHSLTIFVSDRTLLVAI